MSGTSLLGKPFLNLFFFFFVVAMNVVLYSPSALLVPKLFLLLHPKTEEWQPLGVIFDPYRNDPWGS